MSLFQRASKLLTANINHLMDTAEEPEVMIKQLIREMNESVTELRRETVNAVARQKGLQKKVDASGERAEELERKAGLALDHDNQALARRILGERVETLKMRDSLASELESASGLAQRLKADLVRMEEQASVARRKKDELIRRKRAAEAQLRTTNAARRSMDAMSAATGQLADRGAQRASFGGYADEIGEMEARAEAARELSESDSDDELELHKLTEAAEVDQELERLERERASSA